MFMEKTKKSIEVRYAGNVNLEEESKFLTIKYIYFIKNKHFHCLKPFLLYFN